MRRIVKMVAIVLALSFHGLPVGSDHVFAQPFGIMSQQAQQEPQQKVLSSAQGRFVFGQISDSSKDQFMLDTFTGRLWRVAESGEVGLFLRSVTYRTSEGRYSPLPEEISKSVSKGVDKK
jgi:hypothetical protein